MKTKKKKKKKIARPTSANWHFKCTCCSRKCTHVTTHYTVAGINIIPKGQKLCPWCLNTLEHAYIRAVLRIAKQRTKD